MNNLDEILKKEFLLFKNKKIKEENINEYLNSFTKKELIAFLAAEVLINKDYSKVHIVASINNYSKEYIINYIKENLEVILKSYITILKTNLLEQLKYILKNNNKFISFTQGNISIYFIHILKQYSLAKVEYNKKDNNIKFFMPAEFINTFNKCLNDKKVIDTNKYNNRVFEYTISVINTYGIITLNKFHELFCTQMFKIDIDALEHLISYLVLYEEVYIYEYDKEFLLCTMEFVDEDYAIGFYESQKKDYKKFSKVEFKNINDSTYLKSLKSYKKFINYISKLYKLSKKDINDITDLIILDYITTAQTSIEQADDNFRKNILEILELNDIGIEYLLNYMKNIFAEYPKWIKRGNV